MFRFVFYFAMGCNESRLLLRQARTSGKFSEDELSNLKREFQHHKDKIHEYNILMDTISRTEGERLLLTTILSMMQLSQHSTLQNESRKYSMYLT